MRYHKEKKKNKPLRIFLIISLLLILFIFIIDLRIRPLIQKTSQYQSEIIATSIITNTVYSTMTSDKFGYDELVKLSRNSQGNVTSVENNMYDINRLHAYITNNINNEYDKISKKTIIISLGSLSGFNLFYGRGPDLVFKLDPIGSARTAMISKFTSAGVNQTLHEIILEVQCDVSAIIPGYTTVVNVNTQYIIASTIIVGDIPESFTYITGDNRDDLSKIVDYKA